MNQQNPLYVFATSLAENENVSDLKVLLDSFCNGHPSGQENRSLIIDAIASKLPKIIDQKKDENGTLKELLSTQVAAVGRNNWIDFPSLPLFMRSMDNAAFIASTIPLSAGAIPLSNFESLEPDLSVLKMLKERYGVIEAHTLSKSSLNQWMRSLLIQKRLRHNNKYSESKLMNEWVNDIQTLHEIGYSHARSVFFWKEVLTASDYPRFQINYLTSSLSNHPESLFLTKPSLSDVSSLLRLFESDDLPFKTLHLLNDKYSDYCKELLTHALGNKDFKVLFDLYNSKILEKKFQENGFLPTLLYTAAHKEARHSKFALALISHLIDNGVSHNDLNESGDRDMALNLIKLSTNAKNKEIVQSLYRKLISQGLNLSLMTDANDLRKTRLDHIKEKSISWASFAESIQFDMEATKSTTPKTRKRL